MATATITAEATTPAACWASLSSMLGRVEPREVARWGDLRRAVSEEQVRYGRNDAHGLVGDACDRLLGELLRKGATNTPAVAFLLHTALSGRQRLGKVPPTPSAAEWAALRALAGEEEVLRRADLFPLPGAPRLLTLISRPDGWQRCAVWHGVLACDLLAGDARRTALWSAALAHPGTFPDVVAVAVLGDIVRDPVDGFRGVRIRLHRWRTSVETRRERSQSHVIAFTSLDGLAQAAGHLAAVGPPVHVHYTPSLVVDEGADVFADWSVRLDEAPVLVRLRRRMPPGVSTQEVADRLSPHGCVLTDPPSGPYPLAWDSLHDDLLPDGADWPAVALSSLGPVRCSHSRARWTRTTSGAAIALSCPACEESRVACITRDRLPAGHPEAIAREERAHHGALVAALARLAGRPAPTTTPVSWSALDPAAYATTRPVDPGGTAHAEVALAQRRPLRTAPSR